MKKPEALAVDEKFEQCSTANGSYTVDYELVLRNGGTNVVEVEIR